MNMSNSSAAAGGQQPNNYTAAPHNTNNNTGGINSVTAGQRQFTNTGSSTMPPNDNATSSTTMNHHHHHQQQQQQQSSTNHMQPTTMMMMPENIGSSILEEFENETISTYNPPGIPPMNRSTTANAGSNTNTNIVSTNSNNSKHVQWVHNPSDGSVLQDHRGKPISVDRILATKPLKDELSSRKGPGGKSLSYMSGDGVSRTLNDIFGFDGWNFDVKKVEQVGKNYDKNKERYEVVYSAHVRVTHRLSGSYREDIGTGDSIDKSYATAVGHALKGSITDALKRAARHLGDKLGGALYGGNLTKKNAPATLKDALDKYEIERANSKFGFPKDQQKAASIVASEAAAAIAVTNPSSTANSINRNSQHQQQQKTQNQPYHHQQKQTHQTHHHHHKQQQSKPAAVAPGGTNMNKPTNGLSHGSTHNHVHYSSTSGNNNGNTTNGPAMTTSYNGNASSRPSLPQIPKQQQPQLQAQPQPQPKSQQQPQQRQYQQNGQIKPPAQNQSQIPQAQGTMTTPAARPPQQQQQQQTQVTSSRPPSRYGGVGVGGGHGQGFVETTIHPQNPYGNSQASSTSVAANAQSSSISSNPQQQQQQQQYRPPLSLQTNTNQFSGTGPTAAAGTGQEKPGINNNNMASKRPAPSNNAVNNPYQSNSKIGRHSM